MTKEKIIDIEKLRIEPDQKINLKDFNTHYDGTDLNKEEAAALLVPGLEALSSLQDKLYASGAFSLLIILQAMDAAGKDSVIRHVMTGFNPQGVKVTSFKVPTSAELSHDYFWRHYKELPARGDIGIFNRSHYENVIITRVHPKLILNEKLPDVKSVADVDDKFWKMRYKQINRFEKNITQNGTLILKFFLHVSKKEQKKRFIERIDNPKKNWKFSPADLKERGFWKDYQDAYENCINETSTDYAPWFVIPADDKWFTRLAIAEIIRKEFEKLKLDYPHVGLIAKEELEDAKRKLMEEMD